VKPGRRDTSRRVTPDVIAFYARRAHDLRAECYRDMWHGLWASLKRIIGGLSR
jgi:hypothetical protein